LSARLILASASLTRKKILADANVPFEAAAPNIDERRIKDELLAQGAKPDMIAATLAEQKALGVAGRVKNSLVLGADQVLVCEGKLFSKAENLVDARETLRQFRGRKHELISAMALVRNGFSEWRYVEIAELWVRDFSDAFLDAYLEQEGEDILGSVGCYRIEGGGAQLFEKIVGDQSAICGLPIFPLLDVLREKGIIPA